MKKSVFIKCFALLLTLHFCAMSSYSYPLDKVAIEAESETDEEPKEEKKDHKLTSLSFSFDPSDTWMENDFFHAELKEWNSPHIEINSPPPKNG